MLLAGGYDKQVDLSGMAAAIARGAKAVALMGQTAGTLEGMIRRLSVTAAGPELRLCGDFDEAFAFATSQSQPGDVVLLSPGCASYDWFRNFADRGEQFARRAKAWRP